MQDLLFTVWFALVTMRALLENSHDKPCDMALGEIDVPTPGPDEVLVKVRCAATNPVDCKRSFMGIPDAFPVVVGYDMAGVVEKVGDNVKEFAAGDRVFGDVQAVSAGPKTSGSVAEYCSVPAALLARLPDSVSFRDGAAMPVALQTTIEAMDRANMKEGDAVFVSGGAGGVGIHALQVLKTHYGASKIATTASTGKIEMCKEYADVVVDYKKENAAEVLGGFADVILDTTAESAMEFKILKGGGRLVSIAEFGTPGVTSIGLTPDKAKTELTASLLAEGKVKAVIDSVYSLDDAMKAIERQQSGRAVGKIIVEIC